MKHAIVCTAGEEHTSRRGEHGSPVLRLSVRMRPDAFTGIDIPRLNFTDMVGALSHEECRPRTRVWAPRRIGDRGSDRRPAKILVRRNVDHPRLGTERDWRPVLAA